MWLAAAAARSASTFGAAVVDLYFKALAEAGHALKVFDSLFGLAAIAMSDETAADSILDGITRRATADARRQIVGALLADVAFRSAIAVLQRWKTRAATLSESVAALSWQTLSVEGLATVEAFRADPTVVDTQGEMIGFAALPTILATQPSFAYPPQITRSQALIPTIEEMGELFRHAWIVHEVPATVH